VLCVAVSGTGTHLHYLRAALGFGPECMIHHDLASLATWSRHDFGTALSETEGSVATKIAPNQQPKRVLTNSGLDRPLAGEIRGSRREIGTCAALAGKRTPFNVQETVAAETGTGRAGSWKERAQNTNARSNP